MNTSVAAVMADAGTALNATFGQSLVELGQPVSGSCGVGLATLEVPEDATVDYVVSAENMVHGARVANYSIDFQATGSDQWQPLVPPVHRKNHTSLPQGPAGLGDRPDGHVCRKGARTLGREKDRLASFSYGLAPRVHRTRATAMWGANASTCQT